MWLFIMNRICLNAAEWLEKFSQNGVLMLFRRLKVFLSPGYCLLSYARIQWRLQIKKRKKFMGTKIQKMVFTRRLEQTKIPNDMYKHINLVTRTFAIPNSRKDKCLGRDFNIDTMVEELSKIWVQDCPWFLFFSYSTKLFL